MQQTLRYVSEKRQSAQSGDGVQVERDETRYIILIDMDAYYAQVEMKKHKIDLTQPCVVQQWNAIIALNYVAKGMGVKRSMTVYDALCICPDLILIHVSTMTCSDIQLKNPDDFRDQKHVDHDAFGGGFAQATRRIQQASKTKASEEQSASESDDEDLLPG